jgi:formylglycine-generating enzyme
VSKKSGAACWAASIAVPLVRECSRAGGTTFFLAAEAVFRHLLGMSTYRFVSRLVIGLAALTGVAQAVPPSISNIQATQRPGTKLVDVSYTLTDPDSGSITVQVEMSSNSGQSYDLPVRSVSGAIGAGVTPGSNKQFTWNAGLDWSGNFSNTCRVRLYAYDGSTPVPPLGMVYVPAGTFVMGWESPSSPGGNMTLTRSYFMDRYEVSGQLWATVRDWGNANGYSIPGGGFRAVDHPVQSVSWAAAVAWCNARSEREGLTPCYYTDALQMDVSRSGSINLVSGMVKWTANGYRLPTETEWERAARGGLDRKLYPWSDTIANHQANYSGSGDPFESPTPGTTPVGYYNGNQVPAGQNMANGYGLYDMAGNVSEWCWDRYSSLTYGLTDPIGSDTASYRVFRGGSFSSPSSEVRCVYRAYVNPSGSPLGHIGFRCVRSQ